MFNDKPNLTPGGRLYFPLVNQQYEYLVRDLWRSTLQCGRDRQRQNTY